MKNTIELRANMALVRERDGYESDLKGILAILRVTAKIESKNDMVVSIERLLVTEKQRVEQLIKSYDVFSLDPLLSLIK